MADPSAGFFEGTEKRPPQLYHSRLDSILYNHGRERFSDFFLTCSEEVAPSLRLQLRRIEIDFRGDGSLRNAPRSDWETVVTLSATQKPGQTAVTS